MPCDYSKYPATWFTEIRPRILARAGEVRNKEGKVLQEATCEWPGCTAKNRAIGIRDVRGIFRPSGQDAPVYFKAAPGARPFRVILTIAHKDHDIANNEDENLAAWCQFHHLKHDAKQHAKTIRENREKRERERRGEEV
jgi:hypothetical protein